MGKVTKTIIFSSLLLFSCSFNSTLILRQGADNFEFKVLSTVLSVATLALHAHLDR